MFTKPKTGDIIIISVILFMAVANLVFFMGQSTGASTAQIIKNGKIIKEIKLSEVTSRIEIRENDQYNILIAAENGKIHFEESNCPDQVCVKTGWISRPGQSAACVPAGIIVKIVGDVGENSDTDIILK